MVGTAKKSGNGRLEERALVIAPHSLRLQTVKVRIVGDSSLICHKFSDAATEAILNKQMDKGTAGRKAKDPKADYEASIYRNDEGDCCFPASGIKKAIVSAAPATDFTSCTGVRRSVQIIGDLLPIEDSKPQMRRDIVRIGGKSADVRHRAEFVNWTIELTIRFNSAEISAEQIVQLLNIAGFGVGLGDWRPEKNGSHGMFHVSN